MSELTQADRYLLDQIRRGEADGWSQLTGRYEGRLLAFARSRLAGAADSEDLVQETFIAFLNGLPDYRAQASIETYLFTILRRKIVDLLRRRRVNVCLIQDVMAGGGADDDGRAMQQLAASDPTASWYARRDESHELQAEALARALGDLVKDYKDSLNFRDLQVVELLLYSQLRNKDVAKVVDLSEKQVALIKHRSLKRIRQRIAAALPAGSTQPTSDALLTEIWESQRLSCPKRSTIGAYLLGTLEPAWHDYVAFHLQTLGCRFCLANLQDLQQQTAGAGASRLHPRIMESTIGFLHKT